VMAHLVDMVIMEISLRYSHYLDKYKNKYT